MKLEIPVRKIQCTVENGNLVVRSGKPLRALSSAIINGGLCMTNTILNHQVAKNFADPKPEDYLSKIAASLNLPTTTVGLMTAADVTKASLETRKTDNATICALVTAGVSYPAAPADSLRRMKGAGTINIIILVEGNLSDACMVEAVKTATEAKSAALRELDIRSRFSQRVASGTTTDAIVVACTGDGEPIRYAGTATELGEALGRVVVMATKKTLKMQEGITPERPLIQRLDERGITLRDMLKTAMDFCVYHPAMGSRRKVRKMLEEGFKSTLTDVNVAALLMAGLRLEEDGALGLIPGLKPEVYAKDPVFLVADEILGMGISNYIAGSRGLFEYIRFDRAKPGLLKKLGPFMDDVIGSLIAAVSSNMYTQILDKR